MQGTIVQGIIAILVVATACYQWATLHYIDSDLKVLTFTIVSFFIGGVVQNAKANSVRRQR